MIERHKPGKKFRCQLIWRKIAGKKISVINYLGYYYLQYIGNVKRTGERIAIINR
jgi:hypothetical protein